MLTLDLQLYAVLVMFLTGVALGLMFDVYRGVRSALNPGPIATGIGDIVFWVVGTLMLIAALIFGTWGEVRLFVPIAIGLGLALYRALAGRSVARATRRLIGLIARAVRIVAGWLANTAMVLASALISVVRIALWPVFTVLGLFRRPVDWLRRQATRWLSPLTRLRRRIAETLRTLREGPHPPPDI